MLVLAMAAKHLEVEKVKAVAAAAPLLPMAAGEAGSLRDWESALHLLHWEAGRVRIGHREVRRCHICYIEVGHCGLTNISIMLSNPSLVDPLASKIVRSVTISMSQLPENTWIRR